jgi:hypothetical protein
VLRHRWKVVIASLIFFAASFATLPLLNKEFLPAEDQGRFGIRLQTPVGSSLEYTDSKFKQAEALIMLTNVERVALDFNRPTQRWLDRMSQAEAREHAAAGQFPPGSMGPKIDAAVTFLQQLPPQSGGDHRVLITSIDKAYEALMGRAGTQIVR